ncbi:MAG: DnaA/Hda family protein [Longimicrobiales bacterium]|nr:DnaA/Hda family protein [Longimicrobiales bacterium]
MAKLDPHFTFETFVVGPANRLASAAARRAAERPGVSYNPLFIYASSGLGKTHVLGAIAHHVAKVAPDKRVEFQTPEEFLREFVKSSGTRSQEEVRTRYREVDVLLVDDVQFLTTQSDFQALLLLTLDTLAADGKQVVLASDRPPAEIGGLGAHLRTRFECGLLVDIGPPEYETRVAIIKKWVEARLQILDPGVDDAIGRFPFQTVTEIQTALNRVLKSQAVKDRTVTPEEATAILESPELRDPGPPASELGKFLEELSDTVAARVRAQEEPWRCLLREVAEEVEAEEFKADGLRRRIEGEAPPQDLDGLLREFRRTIQRLKEIRTALDAAGNPWPEAAFGVLRDPERLDEAEALLASALEQARPFPEILPGPLLNELRGEVPALVIRAADQLANTDRPEYNPLFVWSPDGLAVRALLHAAGRTRLRKQKEARVALTSVQEFSRDFIHSLSQGVSGAWRERWWSADLLLIDGAQDLSTTERAQEEFFQLFEALQRRRARIMIAADRPPAEIPALDDRLRARLEGGLIVEVQVDASELSPELRKSLRETEAPEVLPEPEKRDILAEDREWIRSFQPGAFGAGRGPSGPGSGDEGPSLVVWATGQEGSIAVEAWVPSPEQVVWDWPKLGDRIVEELD